MKWILGALLLQSLFVVSGCGVKGKPQPMLTAPQIGTGDYDKDEEAEKQKKQKGWTGEGSSH